jgi:hypothetical protein
MKVSLDMVGWHYSLILVKKAQSESEEDEGLLVELYLDDAGEPWGFTKANLISFKDLELASQDVALQQGVLNPWFYERGVFTWENGVLEYTSKGE